MIMVSGRSSSSEDSSESSSPAGIGGAAIATTTTTTIPNGGCPHPVDTTGQLQSNNVNHQPQQVQLQPHQHQAVVGGIPPPLPPVANTNNASINALSTSSPITTGTAVITNATTPTTTVSGILPLHTCGGANNSCEANNHILVTLQEKRIIQEFCHLLEKSKQLFNQLRDLPPHFSTLGSAYNPQSQSHHNGGILTNHHQIMGGSVSSSSAAGPAGPAATLSCQQAYFSRAFDIYTRLWKFQQMHRATLDKKYGLKRWQIGDIASKIGQLYFHYYLRTSELAYLHEAYSFYGAIRARGYYAGRSSRSGGGHHHNHHHNNRRDSLHSARASEGLSTSSAESSGLIVKKLRYYARFIVVSLLLRKHNVKDLLRELSLHVENYVATVDDEPEEQLEWNLVLSEIRSFIEADSPVVVYDNSTDKLVDPLDQVVILSHRLPRTEIIPKNYRPLEEFMKKDSSSCGSLVGSPLMSPYLGGANSASGGYKLHELLIIGNKQDQLKFSELTVDMFRMTQTFERALPVDNDRVEQRCANMLSLGGASGEGQINGIGCAGGGSSSDPLYKNPHKYLLYRAPIEQVLVTLNAAWSDLAWNGVLLLYISGDPCIANNQGIATTTLKGINKTKSLAFEMPKQGAYEERREINCLYPCDLIPLTRKPLFLIVDSDNSQSFLDLTREKNNFGKPIVLLMSPEVLSSGPVVTTHATSTRGSIFTLFLHCPLAGLCTLCGVKSLSLTAWNQLEHLLNIFFSETFEKIKCITNNPASGGSMQESGGDGGTISNNGSVSNWDVYLKLMSDDFLRVTILRFLFCQVVFELHKEFQNPKLMPKCYPEVSLLEGEDTNRFEELIVDMADLIQAKHLFNQLI